MADFDSIKIAAFQHIEDIPEHVQYPSLRIGLENIVKGDKVMVQITVKDKDEVIKFDEKHRIILKEYPDNGRVVGRGVLNLIEVPVETAPAVTE